MSGLPSIEVTRKGRVLSIAGKAPEAVAAITVRLTSDRNRKIDTLTDTSPHAPKRAPDKDTETILADEQMWFPIVDVEIAAGVTGTVVFTGNGDAQFAINGMFHKAMHRVADAVDVSGELLLPWENSVFVAGADRVVTGFYVSAPAEIVSGAFRRDIVVLSEDWSGEVEAVNQSGETIASTVVAPAPKSAARPGRAAALDTDRVAGSLNATLRYLLRSQVPKSDAPVSQGLFLFYDHDARTFRTPHWNWSWGPAIRLLLEAAAESSPVAAGERGGLAEVAREVGAASLRFQVRDPQHPARGYSLGRWSPGLKNKRKIGYVSPSSDRFPVAGWSPSYAAEKFEAGFEGYYSPADSLFLAGWGWVALGERKDGGAFVDAANECVDAARRMLETFEIVPQDMPVLVGDWTNYTREEAGFGVEAFAELYRATRNEEVRAVGHRYIDGLIEKLEMPDGLWYRHWWRNTRERTPCEYKSRSLGWAEMGLQAAHRMSPERGYLERAVRLAEHFLAAQDESGAWGLLIDRPLGKTEVSAKGTALWSMLFYRLHRLTGDPRHLAAARRALRWLIDRQYTGPDPDGEGGVISCSAFSGVNYRRWFKLSCAYTSSFFGLAALEELRLQ
jgi:hypothetical protein